MEGDVADTLKAKEGRKSLRAAAKGEVGLFHLIIKEAREGEAR